MFLFSCSAPLLRFVLFKAKFHYAS